ncbi:MAG: hypothetical protein OXH22_10155 [Chloroflexi bacterium]|nr:hypothetical protein [Chloroflexota bacterium]
MPNSGAAVTRAIIRADAPFINFGCIAARARLNADLQFRIVELAGLP